MSRKKIGIIGGAGPSAGVLLFDKVIEILQDKYGCKQDHEFPHMFLLNFPFSNMISKDYCEEIIQEELKECFEFLKKNDVEIAAIACNTLHAFLPEIPTQIHLVHIIEEVKTHLKRHTTPPPLVLCTRISSKKKLHQKYFPCQYANTTLQKILDKMIADITLGADLNSISDELTRLIPDEPILLGCTEFSLLNEKAPLRSACIYDPNTIVAEKIADLYINP